jgi:hypothetical protein
MRILIGTTEIAGLLSNFANGFRKIGHEVTTVVWQRNEWWPVQYDVDLSQIQSPTECISIIKHLIESHDVFFFLWARQSLLHQNQDYPILKQLGKKIILYFVGSDVRAIPAYKQWYQTARKYLDQLPFNSEPIGNPLYAIRAAEMFSDLIFSVPDQSVVGVRPYMHAFVPMNLSSYTFNVPARNVPLVVHAPSRGWLKGTKYIMKALEDLQAEGVSFDIRLLQDIPNQKVIDAFVDADVVIDELFFPLYGKTTLEAMACGCAVANGDNEEYEPFPPNRPICQIYPENIRNQLRHLLTNKALRIRLAHEGRNYVEKYHDHITVAQQIIQYLNNDNLLQNDYYPTFYAREFRLPNGEVIPEELKRMTTKIIQQWGCPEDVCPEDMISRGLMSSNGLDPTNPIPRWKVLNR